MTVRFGYGLITCQRYPGDARSDVDLYAEALGAAEEAERLGFDSVWTSEHHFADDSYAPSLLPLSAAMAARASRIQIGTGLVLAPLYHPIRLAEDVAVVDLISGGRFVLGLGQGWLRWEFEALGAPFGQRGRRVQEAIQTCRQAWGNGLLETAGVAVLPRPARSGGPPIWVGAHSEPPSAVRPLWPTAGLRASPTLARTRVRVQWLADEIRRRARPPREFHVAGYWPVFTWAEAGRAWEMVRPFHHYVQWKYLDAERARGRLGPLPLPPALGEQSEAALRAEIICGAPAEVAACVAELADIARVAGPRFTFIARMHYPGMDPAIVRAAARLFAEEVIPAVRARVPGSD
jgi:alkanesulfonate monooxygenase SsuD/methylene tetrahydromethanopterin reductase-like flavin-dependent oxidoreductase (luciferase family)